eukprot:7385731-Prymnesium_polylepis.1
MECNATRARARGRLRVLARASSRTRRCVARSKKEYHVRRTYEKNQKVTRPCDDPGAPRSRGM